MINKKQSTVVLNDVKRKELDALYKVGMMCKNYGDTEYFGQVFTETADLSAIKIGNYYLKSVSVDKSIADEWWRKAAACFTEAAIEGHAKAQYELGYCYYKGKGVPEDKAQAIEWFRKAAAQGNENAKEELKELENS